MPAGNHILRSLYRIRDRVDGRQARTLLLVVLTALAAVGCDGGNGGGY